MDLIIEPTPKQLLVWKRLVDDKTKFILFGGGAGGGKSWMICEWLIYMCLKYPQTKWFIGREELKRLMASTFLTLLAVFKKHNIPASEWSLNGQYNYIIFSNGSRIDLLDVKNVPSDPLYERFGSMEFTGGALEEVGEIHYGAFDMLKSRIGRCKNLEYKIPSKILLTCNPKKNWAYYEFYKPTKENTISKDKCFIQALYYDNPYTAKEYKENLSSITDKIMKQRLMLGNWEYDDDPSRLFEYDNLVNMFTNQFVLKETDKRYLSVDIARFGEDRTIIILWKGLYIENIYQYSKKDTEFVKQEITRISTEKSIPRSQIVVDEDGIGGGVVDGLKGVKGFVNNSRPYQNDKIKENNPIIHNYGNLKTQCYFALADKVNKNEVGIYKDIPTETKERLIEDLEQIKRKDPDKDGKLYVTPKEEIKESIGRSSDYGDAMMMRMFFDVASPPPLSYGFISLTKRQGFK